MVDPQADEDARRQADKEALIRSLTPEDMAIVAHTAAALGPAEAQGFGEARPVADNANGVVKVFDKASGRSSRHGVFFCKGICTPSLRTK